MVIRAGLLLVVFSALGLDAGRAEVPRYTRVSAPQAAKLPALSELSQSFQDLAARVSPSVVQIFVTGYALPDNDAETATDPVLERGSGSGVIVSPDGYIVTNAHVIENATRIEVELPFAATGGDPGKSILGRRGRTVGAQVVAIDDETDLAVIKVPARALPALAFGDSDTLRPGQIVLAFGSPLGLSSSVTMGVVSAVARQLAPEDPMIYIQTDATINPGNSGGALVDASGRLVGINTLIFSQSGGSEGIGFAAPSNIVRNIVGQIVKFGRVRRGEIGVNAQTITPTLAEALSLPVDTGVVLADVAPGGPAARAGLRPGDIVTTLDGKPMENGRQLRINIYSKGAGEQITLEVRRGERTVPIRVPVVERASGMSRLEALIGSQQPVSNLGITVIDLTPAVAQLLPGLRRDKGAVIARVTAEAPFSQQGRLMPGDVIYTLNGKTIESGADVLKVAAELARSSAAVMHIERDGVLHYIAFRVER
jgi:serine protease Do